MLGMVVIAEVSKSGRHLRQSCVPLVATNPFRDQIVYTRGGGWSSVVNRSQYPQARDGQGQQQARMAGRRQTKIP